MVKIITVSQIWNYQYLKYFDNQLILYFTVWDIRANGCRFSLKKTEDSITSMITINDGNNQPTLACTSGDGTLTIIDLSTKKMVVQVL